MVLQTFYDGLEVKSPPPRERKRIEYGQLFAPHYQEVLLSMGQRLGIAARAKRLVNYAQLGKGLRVPLPGETGSLELVDPMGRVSDRAKAVIDEYLFVLSRESYREARILAIALLDQGGNRPAQAFYEAAARLTGQRAPTSNNALLYWSRYLEGVFGYFSKLPPLTGDIVD